MASVFSLPDELLIKVFSYLSVPDVSLSVAEVCTHWHSLACDTMLWNSLVLTVDKSMELSYILELIPHLTQLRYINLHWRTDTAHVIKLLCEHCPHLVGIKLICCGFMERGCVRELYDHCHNLKMLSLGKSWAVPHQCLDDIVLFTNLTHLNLSHSLLTPEQFRLISLSCKKLLSLNIDYVRGVSEKSLVDFISPRKNVLQSLSVFGDLLTDSIFKHIELCFNLKLLHLSTCRNISDSCFHSIEKLKCLKYLTLRKSVNLSSEALYNFYFHSGRVKNLYHLYISAKRVVNEDDISVWLDTSFMIENTLSDQFCTCILTKEGFKIDKVPV